MSLLPSSSMMDVGWIMETERGGEPNEPLYEKFNGLYTVRMESYGRILYHVSALCVGVGSGMQSGQVYPKGTRVILGYATRDHTPYILGALPFSYSKTTAIGETEILEPGEVQLRSGMPDSENPNEFILPGGKIKIDNKGRVIISSATNNDVATITLGIQGEKTVLTVGTEQGAGIEIDNDGTIRVDTDKDREMSADNVRCKVSGDEFNAVSGNRTDYVEGIYTVLHVKGTQIQINTDGSVTLVDPNGSIIGLNAGDGSVTISDGKGDYIHLLNGQITVLSTGDVSVQADTVSVEGGNILLGQGATKGVVREGDAVVIFDPLCGINVVGQAAKPTKYPNGSPAPPAPPGVNPSEHVVARN
jgi:hypothetical protein